MNNPHKIASHPFSQFAALVEILLVLALGNLIGATLYTQIAPPSVALGEAGEMATGLYEGLRIFLRIGFIGLLGLILLYWRKGMTPKDAGLTKNNHTLSSLMKSGFVLGSFSALLGTSFFYAYFNFPFGEGLTGWTSFGEREANLALYIELLATAIIVPPIMEEIMARGYNRVRLVENYGSMAGVILAGLIFAVSHTRYISSDPTLFGFFIILLINSISWTYLAQRTGSIISPIIAHAMANGLGMLALFIPEIALLIAGAFALYNFKAIIEILKAMVSDFIAEKSVKPLMIGVAYLALISFIVMTSMSYLGRTNALAGIALTCLVITFYNTYLEKRQ